MMEIFRTYTQMSEATFIMFAFLLIIATSFTIAFIINLIMEYAKSQIFLGACCLIIMWFSWAVVAIKGTRDTYIVVDAATIDWGTVTKHYQPTEINDRLVTLKVLDGEE